MESIGLFTTIEEKSNVFTFSYDSTALLMEYISVLCNDFVSELIILLKKQ